MEALYFTATWCQPCKVFGPIMDKIGDDFPVRKLDIADNGELVDKYDIMSVPTVVFIRDGDITGSFIGARTEQWVRDFIKEME